MVRAGSDSGDVLIKNDGEEVVGGIEDVTTNPRRSAITLIRSQVR